MTDACDDEFFCSHVWPLLLKDVRLLLVEKCSNVTTDAVQRVVQSEFVSRRYTIAHLTVRGSTNGTRMTAERELKLAAMQSYALMYDTTLSLAAEAIEAARWNEPAASLTPEMIEAVRRNQRAPEATSPDAVECEKAEASARPEQQCVRK